MLQLNVAYRSFKSVCVQGKVTHVDANYNTTQEVRGTKEIYPKRTHTWHCFNMSFVPYIIGSDIYTTLGAASSHFHGFLAARSQIDTDHDQIWQACADRSGNGSYLNKLAP